MAEPHGEIVKRIAEKGQKEKLSGNTPIYLRELGYIWFLEKGSVNLFAIERKEGSPEGMRTLIATLTAPCSLFAFAVEEQASHEVVAITEKESIVWKAEIKEVEAYFCRDPLYLNKWINQLAIFHGKELGTETAAYVEAPQIAILGKEETLSLKRAFTHAEKEKINWVEIERGDLEFLGYGSLPLAKKPFPLTYTAWLKSRAGAVVSASEKTENWKEGLQHYHEILLKYILTRKEIGEREERERSEQRKKIEDEALHASLKEMAEVLGPVETEEPLYDTIPLFNACRIVGSSSEILFRLPEKIPEKIEASQLLCEIALASEVRYRQVKLSGRWWKKDCGNMVAFYGEDLKPVALITKKPGCYAIIDPTDGKKIKVDKKAAARLHENAYYFYPCFPNELKTGKEMFRYYLKHNKKEFFPLVWYSVIAALISLFPPFATERLMNNVIPDANAPLLWEISFGLMMAAGSASLFLFFRSLMVARLEGLSSDQLLSGLWDRMLKLPLAFFRRYSTGNLIMRVMSAEWMRSLISGNSIRVLFSGVFSLFYLLAMALYAPALTLIAFLVLLFGFSITLLCAAFYAKKQQQYFELEGKINAFVIQIISSVGKLRTTGSEKNAFANFAHQFSEFKRVDLKAQNIRNIVLTMNYILPFVMYLFIFGYAFEAGREYSIGAFLAFNTAFVTFYIAMTDLSNTLLEMTPILPLWNRSRVIVEEPLEEQLKAKNPGRLTGEIHVDEVSFKYEGSENFVLNTISMKANPKEFVGIIGPSGCGKSTLIRILLGFERPTSGAVYYDDKDLSSFTIHEFRKQLGVVLQEEGIIAGSIYDNLTCGKTYKSQEVQRALQISGFEEDIELFPMGLHTHLPTGGTTLSGGQKQRLLIARALLPNPKILLLDEATSALDNRNQDKVIKSIDQLDVTRIVIAHRLSTIRNADRIYVMDKGRFVQTGTYEELLSKPGLFAEMLKRQSL
ncbi:MAG: NHLP bacteriocin export ABC transporter permease/ATPase subunit [Chlamydiales bacterium]|nr:NHLP bacteriocin export ABC transporter permease/ATPase subunit [Chlamydiales bacterium]